MLIEDFKQDFDNLLKEAQENMNQELQALKKEIQNHFKE